MLVNVLVPDECLMHKVVGTKHKMPISRDLRSIYISTGSRIGVRDDTTKSREFFSCFVEGVAHGSLYENRNGWLNQNGYDDTQLGIRT